MVNAKPLFVSVAGQQLICRKGGQQFIHEADIRESVQHPVRGKYRIGVGLEENSIESTTEKVLSDGDTTHLLGIYNQRPCYAVSEVPEMPLSSGFEWRSLRSFLGHVDDLHFDLAGRACQIINWDREHRFCGSCGQATVASQIDNARLCVDCDRQYFPRISPCVIVVIVRDDHCLLARNAAWERRYFSALAGFIEPGETVEQALHREVMEEVGIEVGGLTYFGSQPWPFPGQLMLGFHAAYKAGEIKVDQQEIVEADWWHYQNLPPCPSPYTLSGRLIEHFVRQFTDKKCTDKKCIDTE